MASPRLLLDGSQLHGGIQYWTATGTMGWLLDVVLRLRPASTGPGRLGHVGAHPYAARGPFNSFIDSLSPSPPTSTSAWSTADRLPPHLPTFTYSEGSVLPNIQNMACTDVPLSIYRQQRLHRALGDLAREQLLPPAKSIPAPTPAPNGRTRGQYTGDVRCAVWNAQAFFAQDEARHQAKNAYLQQLLTRCDVVMITEAHGTTGRQQAWRTPLGFRSWWSAGPTTGHAGIGIVVRDSFFAKFEDTQREPWQAIWPGRAGRLQLRGREGALDLIVSYFHTGATIQEPDLYGVPPAHLHRCTSFLALRELLRARISQYIVPATNPHHPRW